MNVRQRLADHSLVLAIGFFGLVAQTLLFRDFLTACEGNELGIASFFCSWLLWVAVGALVARRDSLRLDVLNRHFPYLPLLYVAAYVLQAWLIGQSREWAGIKAYELFSFGRMLPVSFVVNAPVSFCTGLLFTLACRWLSDTQAIAVARVYATEAAGSFAGGVAVTLLLAAHGTAELAVVLAAGLLVAAAAFQRLSRSVRVPGWTLLVLAVAVPLCRPDRAWTQLNDEAAWQRFFPGQTHRGSFVTPQARYLYGEHQGQFVVAAWNSIVETVPATESASQVIAVHLAQQPEARRFLVVGPASYAICRRLLELPQLASVTWLTPDPAYARCLLAALPQPLRARDSRLEVPGEDVRGFLRRSRAAYDVVILDLPDVTTLALNRYFTREFFSLLKPHVAPAGIVGVRVSGGENFMGDELINAGTSVFETLRALFRNLAIKPGEESWLIASDGDRLTEEPAALRDRFRAVKGAAAIYPPEGLMALYVPDRADFQRAFYARASGTAAQPLLLNTDRHPKALLHSLLFSARQGGASPAVTRRIGLFACRGLPIVVGAVLLYAMARWLYRVRGRSGGDASAWAAPAFDRGVMVLLTGAVGMSANLLFMYLYQSAFGSIFLYVGLLSAVFMLGLAAGSLASERVLIRGGRPAAALLPVALVLHALLLAAVAVLPSEPGHAGFVGLFLATGLLSGVYVPVAAAALKREAVSDRAAGARVDALDHLGGAIGGMVAGSVLIPLFGGAATLLILALLALVNLPPLVVPAAPTSVPDARDRAALAVRPVGYVLGVTAVVLLVAALVAQRAATDGPEQRLENALHRMAPGAHFTRHARTLPDGGTLLYFAQAGEGTSVKAYGFATDRLAPGVVGYAGPVSLAVLAAADGTLLGVEILRSGETPAYLAALGGWLARLKGLPVFGNASLAGVDAVTGATLSSLAIRDTLRQAGGRFAAQVLGLDARAAPAPADPWRPGRETLVLGLLIVATFVLRIRPHRNARRLVLLAALVLCGVWLNLQYSSDHVLSLAGVNLPPAGLAAAFLLTVALPLLVVCFGNFYCGYLCPFGAAQELIGDLRPAGWRTPPTPALWRWTRRVKYLLLFVLVVLFAVTLDPRLASADPLTTVFSRDRFPGIALLAAGLLLASFFFNRFWCRVLCPAGAWLALLGGIRLFRRLSPQTEPALCVYGVESRRELDCIGCDRCRRIREADVPAVRSSLAGQAARPWQAIYAVAAAVVAALVLGGMLASHPARSDAEPGQRAAPVAAGAGGQARDVEMTRLRGMIREGHLSDHKALYWKPVEDGKGASTPSR